MPLDVAEVNYPCYIYFYCVSEVFCKPFYLLRIVMYAAHTDVLPIFLGRLERLPGRLEFHNHFRYICNFNSLRGIRVSSYHIEC